jgi:hypothetical protein
MGLLDFANRDIKDITTNSDGFAVTMILTTPDGQTSAEVKGLSAKHNLGLDSEGLIKSETNVHVSLSEKTLTDAGFTVRDAEGRVDLENYRVTVADSSGVDYDYVVREQFPDSTIGLIVLLLNLSAD